MSEFQLCACVSFRLALDCTFAVDECKGCASSPHSPSSTPRSAPLLCPHLLHPHPPRHTRLHREKGTATTIAATATTMSDQHRPSPTPSAFSSTLPPSFRARLRIRPHAPLPTEPFLLPINIPSAASFPSLGNTDTSQDDLSFLAGRIVSHVPQARSELPQPTDLALYLDGFRLTGWDTKLSDLIRDGDVIE